MPLLDEMVSATISVNHMKPSANRTPTRIEGKAPGRITSRNKARPLRPYERPISMRPASTARMPCKVLR